MWTLQRAASRLAVVGAFIKAGNLPRLTQVNWCHSSQTLTRHIDMRVRLLPALEDNYMYLIIDDNTKKCAIVDPVEPKKVLDAVKEEGAELISVLTTHHHWDHAGGNKKLLDAMGGKLAVYGEKKAEAVNNVASGGDKFKIGSLNVECLHTPCHTSGHICYFVTGESGKDPAVFTGDTLFMAGCGKFFEGTAANMYRALVEILGGLPNETKVYCGHEYTVANLKYAQHVEPQSEAIKNKLLWAQDQRNSNKPTIPSTIEGEKQFNPFMRVKEPSVQAHAKQSDPVKVMDFLRNEKNGFRATK